MSRILLPLMVIILAACSSTPKTTGVLAPRCGKTAVTSKDLAAFGFVAPKNKITIYRVMATWCPFCKEDLAEIGKRFKSGEFNPAQVNVLLMMYKNSRESKSTYDRFLRDTFPTFGIPSSATQIVYVDKTYSELIVAKSSSGDPLFTGWQGVPFGLVFGKDGRLAFRGHFTTSPQFQDGHYAFIADLAKENCPPN